MEDLDDGITAVAAHVAIIGAGWAGLAAAVELCSSGVPVTVFEASHHPGGRARPVQLEGVEVDNGQHILIGAYRETLAMMRRVGVDPELVLHRMPLDIRYADGFHLRAARLPYPLNLAIGLLAANRLPIAEAIGAMRFMRHLQRQAFRVQPDRAVSEWLDAHSQRGVLRSHLWEPLCLSALNTPPGLASAQVFANVLRDGLTGSARASDLLVARSNLGKLFPEPAIQFLRSRGGRIELGMLVRKLAAVPGGFRINDRPEFFSAVILACGPHHAHPLLRGFPALDAARGLMESFEYEPIVTAYLQYPASVSLPAVMLGLTDGVAHWIFDRGVTEGRPGLLSAVISGSGPHLQLGRQALVAGVERSLQQLLGELPRPLWTRVINEKRATFSCRVALARPEGRTAVSGLWLAGDYVASDYPGTLESAVRSGLAAAQGMMQAQAAT